MLKKCTSDSTIVTSQTFYDLRIPSNMVGNRSSAKSIMIGTLFHLLQEALGCGGFNADTALACIIKQDPDISRTISIATTRVPDFGEQISNPIHGFRSLCCLSTVTAKLQDIPTTFHPSYELLASKTQIDNPVAMCFAQSFQPMGIDLVSHFNIIFYPVHVSSTIPLLRGHSTSPESSLSPWDSISAADSRGTSPHVDITAILQQPGPLAHPTHTVSQPQAQSPLLSSPLSPLSPPAMKLLPSSLPPLLPMQPQSPPSTAATTLLTSENDTQGDTFRQSSSSEFQSSEAGSICTSESPMIPRLLTHLAIPAEKKEAAIYKRSFKGLCHKVRNFNAMNFVLDSMGYSLPFRLSADSVSKFSNITAKASEILQYFGWAPTSFEHKTVWYGAAKTLSQLSWNSNVPCK